MTTQKDFFITGGTLRDGALSYVTREADEPLYLGLRSGEFCYVLTSRQMGKSSLMLRTAVRLKAEGVKTVILDLTRLGQNLTAEQWYLNLLTIVGERTGLEDELDEFWFEHKDLGPWVKWATALRTVVLEKIKEPIVLMIDEIDVVRSLPFSTDEFFAGIREFYNRRTQDAELNRLSFALFGVATPSDLIRDTRLTPFNIGKRIELTDFREGEAAVLAEGLGKGSEGAALLKAVHYWTGGHPYLTQRMCREVAMSPEIRTPGDVDELCGRLFLSPKARTEDDNLLFVRDRLLRTEGDLAGLLDLYRRVREGKRPGDEESNPLVGILKLSGIVRTEEGKLRVRNPIYARVFDQSWIETNMPDAEVRRQKAALRRGRMQVGAAAAVVLLMMSVLSGIAIAQRNRALDETARANFEAKRAKLALNEARLEKERAESALKLVREKSEEAVREREKAEGKRREAEAARREEQKQTEMARRNEARARRSEIEARNQTRKAVETQVGLLFERGLVEMSLSPIKAAVSLNEVNQIRENEKLEDNPNLRFALRQAMKHVDSCKFSIPKIKTFSYSRGSKKLATLSVDGSLQIWDYESGNEIKRFTNFKDAIKTIVISKDGKKILVESSDSLIQLFDLETGVWLMEIKLNNEKIDYVRGYSFNEKRVVVLSKKKTNAIIFDMETSKEIISLSNASKEYQEPIFSQDGRLVFLSNSSKENGIEVQVVEMESGSILASSSIPTSTEYFPRSVSFSPDGSRVALGDVIGTIKVWDLKSGKIINEFKEPSRGVLSISFSPDGRYLAVGGAGSAGIYEADTGREIKRFNNLFNLTFTRFSPDGKMIVAWGSGSGIRIFEVSQGTEIRKIEIEGTPEFINNNELSTRHSNGTLKIWNIKLESSPGNGREHLLEGSIQSFSKSGNKVALIDKNGNVKVIDLLN